MMSAHHQNHQNGFELNALYNNLFSLGVKYLFDL